MPIPPEHSRLLAELTHEGLVCVAQGGLGSRHAVLDPTFLYLTILLLAPGHILPFFQKPSMFDVSRELGSSIALYSRKVLIQTKATDILPKWLRFVRGTVAASQALCGR